MPRLRRFEEHRWVGTRRDMRVYDCDDAEQFEALSALSDDENLIDELGLQSFGPDTLAEARNRGFREVKRVSGD
ncbi:MAG: hypothetical protein QNJ71_10795 [Acidimicrobiia bacterium]|nr:hypothetical protein [Acidimicrobiia bacterium]